MMKKTILKAFTLLTCGLLSLSCIAGCGSGSASNGGGGNGGDTPAAPVNSDKYVRVDETGAESATGNFIQFGGYYQSKVKDETLLATLAAKTGDLPTDEDDKTWTSFKYWSRRSDGFAMSNANDFMWYQDITEGTDKYRAVYYDKYRTYDGIADASDASAESHSRTWQDDNGYKKNTVYFFKYEPIKWEIITVRKDGTAMLFSKNVLDAQPFHHTGGSNGEYKTNNYEHSDIRAWLNNDLYNTVFNDAEKAIIQTTNVDNGAASAHIVEEYDRDGLSTNITPYVCNNTQDKVFFLSMAELCDTSIFPDEGGPSTNKAPTDYALMQGLESKKIGKFYNNYWMTRSPLHGDQYVQKTTFPDQRLYAGYHVICVHTGGVVPTINVRL